MADVNGKLPLLLEEARKLKESLRLDKAKLSDTRLRNVVEEVEPVPTTAPLYSMRQRRMLRHNGSVVTFDWSPDKRHLMTVCRNPNSIIWDAFGAQKAEELKTSYNYNTSCSFGPSTSVVAVSGTADNVTVFSLQSSDLQSKPPKPAKRVGQHASPILDCTFFGSDHQVLTGSADSTCGLWDVQQSEAVRIFKQHNAEVLSIALKPKDPFTVFASSSADGSALLWDPRTGACEMKFEGHEGPVNQVCFSPVSDALATASSDGTCRLFDLRADQEITIYSQPSVILGASSLDFAKSGRILFVGYNDSTIHIWDTLKETQITVWCGHSDRVTQVKVSPDGTAIGSSSWDKTVRIWA